MNQDNTPTVQCDKCNYECQEDEMLYRMVDRKGNEYNLCGLCCSIQAATANE